MYPKKIFTTALLLLLLAEVQSQVRSTLRSKTIATNDSVLIDSLSIVPHTFFIENADSSFYELDNINALLRWKKLPDTDSVRITYRVMPKLNALSQRFDYKDYVDVIYSRDRVISPTATRDILQFGNLDYNGSFGRNLSFGNNQDLVFNSQFNLQMNGYIGDSIKLEAALTDNNIPIQPDGSTQMLNDFDRIFLQFSKKNWQISLGDIDLREDDLYFTRFYKRLQGVSYRQTFDIKDNMQNRSILNASIAKGKFARNILPVTEGNQGPYKLLGNNNELYMIILSGTEKVFIDGQLMSRGEDQDYVIDYNLAQISFTPKQMITKDKRVQVEFEYSDRNYLNSMIYFKNEFVVNNKLKITAGIFSNADAKSSPINLTLDEAKRQFLNGIGDSIQQAFFPYEEIVPFSSNKILYQKTDTLVNGIHDSIYVYSTDSLLAKYSLYFAQVGHNRGNYVPLLSGANGQAYQWVAPVNGIPQGSYEPAEFIVTPKKQQVATVAAEYFFKPNTSLRVELSGSKYDVNTFSKKDKANDNGFAGKIDFKNTYDWKSRNDTQRTVYTNLSFERAEAAFQPVERLRSVEFLRDWGLQFNAVQADENLLHVNAGIKSKEDNFIDYQFTNYARSDGYKGFRNLLSHQFNSKSGWRSREILNHTALDDAVNKGFFFRPSAEIAKKFAQWKNIEIGANYALENNQLKNKISDSLAANSFSFENIGAFIRSDPSAHNRFTLNYFTRSNRLPRGKKLQQTDRSQNISLGAELLKNSRHTFKFNLTYRSLKTYHTDYFTFLKPENSFLGRIEYNVNEWKGMLTGNFLYETGSGQEQKRAYTYLEVPAGQGQYTWKDYNEDGVSQLNEFELASFSDEARYIKVFTPTNEFIKANYVQFNYNILLDPHAYLSERKAQWAKLLSKINLQSSLQANKKSVSEKGIEFNPLQGNIADTSVLNLNYIFNNTLSINRLGRVWGLDISRFINYGKALLTYGSESRELKDWILKVKLNLAKNYLFELQQKTGVQNLFTPFFENRNYKISTLSFMPSFTYFRQTKFRIVSGYEFVQMKNSTAYGGEHFKSNQLNVESKYNAFQNTSLTGKFSYNKITFTGDPNTTVGYTMLQGLLPGNNYLWTIDLTKRLLKYLELSLRYEGRKPGGTRSIHIGRASVRAIL